MSANGLASRIQQFLDPAERLMAGMQSPFQRLAQQMQDILGDRGILKEVIQAGEGPPVPRDASVSIHFSAYLEYSDQPFETTSHLKYPRMMKLGRDVTLYGLELGLLSMRKGEFSRFLFLPRYAYGEIGCPPLIPPSATVLYEVQVLDYLDSAEVDEFFALSPALTLLKNREPANEEEGRSIAAMQLPIFLNLSLTLLRLEKPLKALHYGQRALEVDPQNTKALFRCGQACLEMDDYEKARDFLLMAQANEPFNNDINNTLKKFASCYKDFMDKEKEMCSKMFPDFHVTLKK
ncbi:inactive peptidyl-prolyl cis-trans isomerase FKBP6 isoform X2 [Anguilla rostrata]|uniref:inactive peptidyl-prolyl cis-trans isomerase FKBP6 isoform X2 n=1 Tax=Anguilla rostrata TaxID=7938 RepID=UPI0030CF4880